MNRRILHFVLFAALTLPATARAQAHAARDTVAADSIPNAGWRHMAVGGGILAAAIFIDAPVGHYFDGPHSTTANNAANLFDKFGEAPGMVAVVGGLGVTALVTHDRRIAQSTLRAAVGLALADGMSTILKYGVGRQRPYGDPDRDGTDFHLLGGGPAADQSFPSGHATVSFALATTLGDAIGHTWARIGLYGLATGTAWARLQQEDHWVTDVVAGAGIGILSAKFADGRLRIFGLRAPHVLLSPQGAGLRWTVSLPAVR
jgi:membrane-associated phospholipid phosphatase